MSTFCRYVGVPLVRLNGWAGKRPTPTKLIEFPFPQLLCIILTPKIARNIMQDFLPFLQHHWLLTSAFGAVLVLVMLVEYLKNRGNTHHLSPSKAIHLINHENATVIDIRSQEAYTSGHIVGSLSIPANELTKKIDKFKAQPIIIVCATGAESARIVSTLKPKEVGPTYVLSGGIRAWKEAEMPLIKGL
jgi:rhodanese-related sulfurtransferase